MPASAIRIAITSTHDLLACQLLGVIGQVGCRLWALKARQSGSGLRRRVGADGESAGCGTVNASLVAVAQ